MGASTGERGYQLLARDGGMFSFGQASRPCACDLANLPASRAGSQSPSPLAVGAIASVVPGAADVPADA